MELGPATHLTSTLPDGRGATQAERKPPTRQNLLVDITARFDVTTGAASWDFVSLDPDTLDLPPDPFAGFLPRNVTAPEGEGWVNYTVRPQGTLPTGTRIDAAALIIFDDYQQTPTPPIFNTIDALPPDATVRPLPDLTYNRRFKVGWTGTDDEGGSGVAFYDVFVAVDGGDFVPWLTRTPFNAAEFMGDFDHLYAFYVVATDNVGHRPPATPFAQAYTYVTRPLGPEPGGRQPDQTGLVEALASDLIPRHAAAEPMSRQASTPARPVEPVSTLPDLLAGLRLTEHRPQRAWDRTDLIVLDEPLVEDRPVRQLVNALFERSPAEPW